MSKQSRWEYWYPVVAVVVALAWYFYDVAGLTGLVDYGFFVATLAFIVFWQALVISNVVPIGFCQSLFWEVGLPLIFLALLWYPRSLLR